MSRVEREIIRTTKCRECGGLMEGRKGEYKYQQCGLNSVLLKDILVFHCTKCNAVVPEIPAAGVLHGVIAMRLLLKKSLLTGKEVRFLRKLCGYSLTEFSQVTGYNKSVVSRWENDAAHGDGADRMVRLLMLARMLRDIAGNDQPILQHVSVQDLAQEVEEALKMIHGKAANESYEISPDELKRYGGGEYVSASTKETTGTIN